MRGSSSSVATECRSAWHPVRHIKVVPSSEISLPKAHGLCVRVVRVTLKPWHRKLIRDWLNMYDLGSPFFILYLPILNICASPCFSIFLPSSRSSIFLLPLFSLPNVSSCQTVDLPRPPPPQVGTLFPKHLCDVHSRILNCPGIMTPLRGSWPLWKAEPQLHTRTCCQNPW